MRGGEGTLQLSDFWQRPKSDTGERQTLINGTGKSDYACAQKYPYSLIYHKNKCINQNRPILESCKLAMYNRLKTKIQILIKQPFTKQIPVLHVQLVKKVKQ